jgi:16S rRNA (cytidine1402-2'-O)-methyltransferase
MMADTPLSGCLYVVSTPIGNLGDITYRAVETLRTADLIIAEDTRHSRLLLDHYQIRTPTASYHEHNEARETPKLVARMREGATIALISDAGTPLVSDPGARLVRACIDAEVPVVPIPGASAMLSALVASGIDSEQFAFWGFLPRKGQSRAATLQEIVRSTMTAVVYEAPSRVGDTLAELAVAGAGDRAAVVARELTKKFEELRRGTIAELSASIGDVRGEVVIVIAGAEPVELTEDDIRARAIALRADGRSPREIVERLMSELGAPRNLAYRVAHET